MWSQTKQLLKETIESITPARKVAITTGDQAIQHIATELSLEPEVVKKALLFQKPSNSFTVQTDDLLQEVVEETAPAHAFRRKLLQLQTSFIAASTGVSGVAAAFVAPSASSLVGTTMVYLQVIGGPLAFGAMFVAEHLEEKFNRKNQSHANRIAELRAHMIEQAASFDKKHGDGSFEITAELETPKTAPRLT